MHTKELIRFSLNAADEAMKGSLVAIEDAPLTFPTAKGGCHPMWVVGHLALVEAMTHEMLAGETNPIANWGAIFAPGTTPTAKASDYPPFADVQAKYTQLRKRTLALLDTFTEADLDKRVANPPQGLEKHFETYGKALMTLSIHQMIHRSHLTDAVRNAGREVPSPIAA